MVQGHCGQNSVTPTMRLNMPVRPKCAAEMVGINTRYKELKDGSTNIIVTLGWHSICWSGLLCN